MQVLYKGTYIGSWSRLENNDQDKKKITMVCQKLETVSMKIFAEHG
jgi:hypothetical protein